MTRDYKLFTKDIAEAINDIEVSLARWILKIP
jgi:hypothetical protein